MTGNKKKPDGVQVTAEAAATAAAKPAIKQNKENTTEPNKTAAREAAPTEVAPMEAAATKAASAEAAAAKAPSPALKQDKKIIKNRTTAYTVKIAMLGALAFILSLFDFPIFPVVDFLKVDFTSVPTLIGGFVLGPVAAVIIEAIKILLMIIFKGTHTGYVGEFSNFVCAVAFVLPCAIIYARKKGIKWVIIGLAISIAVELVISTLSNYFVMIPLYSKFLTAEIMKIIDSGAYYYLFLPLFNLIKYVSNAIIVFFVYKRISGFLHRL